MQHSQGATDAATQTTTAASKPKLEDQAATAALYVTNAHKQAKGSYPLDKDNKLSSAGEYNVRTDPIESLTFTQVPPPLSNMQTLATYLHTLLPALLTENLPQAQLRA